jgi:hypothetical protein
MKSKETAPVRKKDRDQPRHRVRLPGFILHEDVGLGTVLKKVTSTFGIRPCGGCEQRASALNQWVIFTGRHPL